MATISPDEARHILKYYNKSNRKPSNVVANKYASDMRNGRWRTSGETISFDRNGDLINGQHRLMGVAMADQPQDFVVVYGLEPEVFEVVDNGKTRSNADVLGMMNYQEPAMLSALVRNIIAYEKSGVFDPTERSTSHNFEGVNQITKSQIISYIEENPKVTSYIERYKKNQVVSAPIAAFCYWLLCKKGKEQAEKYLDQIFLGYDLQPDTIQSYLFNKFQRSRNAIQNKMSKTAMIANVILGWKRVAGVSKSQVMQITWDTRRGLPGLD
jgi:hypothetical protein